jgi:hypothetical protein
LRLSAPFSNAGSARCLNGKSLAALNTAKNLAEGAMEAAQFVLKGSIALILVLRMLPRVPGGVRVGGVLRKEQHEDADELYYKAPCHGC